jgi:hypothetical protein
MRASARRRLSAGQGQQHPDQPPRRTRSPARRVSRIANGAGAAPATWRSSPQLVDASTEVAHHRLDGPEAELGVERGARAVAAGVDDPHRLRALAGDRHVELAGEAPVGVGAATAMVASPSWTNTFMSGWKSNPWSVTSCPPGPAGGEMNTSGEAIARWRVKPIFWLAPPNSPSRVSAHTMYTSSSVALIEK